jgi:hypothetical protein
VRFVSESLGWGKQMTVVKVQVPAVPFGSMDEGAVQGWVKTETKGKFGRSSVVLHFCA